MIKNDSNISIIITITIIVAMLMVMIFYFLAMKTMMIIQIQGLNRIALDNYYNNVRSSVGNDNNDMFYIMMNNNRLICYLKFSFTCY